jgi:hypothetical protein
VFDWIGLDRAEVRLVQFDSVQLSFMKSTDGMDKRMTDELVW